MTKEQIIEGKEVLDKIQSIETILKRQKLGRLSGTLSMEHGDFYGAKFFNLYNFTRSKSTGGGTIKVERIHVYEFSDKSGAEYTLSKNEIQQLQEYIKTLLSRRLEALTGILINL